MKSKKSDSSFQMVELDHKQIAVELIDGNVHVNLTHLANKFKKRPADWLRTDESKSYLEALSVTQMCVTADLVKVKQGGNAAMQGTWAMDYRIAMRFAQWLSPEFSIAVDDMLVKLMQGNAVVAEPIGGVWPIVYNGKVGYPRNQILKAAGYTSDTSSTIKHFKKKFPHDHFLIYHIACLSPRLAKLRYDMGKMRQRRIEFEKEATSLKKGGR